MNFLFGLFTKNKETVIKWDSWLHNGEENVSEIKCDFESWKISSLRWQLPKLNVTLSCEEYLLYDDNFPHSKEFVVRLKTIHL